MTNVVKYESGVFANADGLRVKYGLAETRKGVSGTVALKDDDRVLYVDIDWSRLPANGADLTGSIYGSEPESSIPTGAIITAASMETTSAWTGTGAHITIGLVDRTGQVSGGGSANGFWDDLAISSFSTVGTVQTSSGALLNAAVTTAPLYLWVETDTATITAGSARLKITYNVPRVAT